MLSLRYICICILLGQIITSFILRTSDPYVKFKCGNKVVHKSRIISKCLDPVWDEHFLIAIDDVFTPLKIKVYDHDFGFQDDYLGMVTIDLTQLQLNKSTDFRLNLTQYGNESSESWGQILLTITLVPKTQEEKEHFFGRSLRNLSLGTSSEIGVKKLKIQQWDSVVNITLLEAKGLASKDQNGLSDPYVKFKLGTEKYRSKVIPKTLNPIWNEQFDLHTFPEQSKILEIKVYDKDFHGKDDFLGKTIIDLTEMDEEVTHDITKPLDQGGFIHLLLTVSGTLGCNTKSDLSTFTSSYLECKQLMKKYSIWNTFCNINDIGYLLVKVYKAENLMAADIGGKSDPFCVLELVNSRVQTNTEYKTLSPEWNKVFTFIVRDIYEILEITVFDEDRDKKFEFLGKVCIPLLMIENNVKKWYFLKDRKLIKPTKGKILIECYLKFNHIRACIRTFTPKESKLIQSEQKFKRILFIRNVTRLKNILMELIKVYNWVNSCFGWENVPRSLTSLILFTVLTYYFQLYMVPITFLLIFVKHFILKSKTNHHPNLHNDIDSRVDEDEDDNKDNEEKKTLLEKLQSIQETSASVQNVIGEIASFGEKVENTFNFSVPFLSYLAIVGLILISILLYFVPIRYLILIWGINKFTKKLRCPNSLSNNELFDFISRAPDIDELKIYRSINWELDTTNTGSIRRNKKRQ